MILKPLAAIALAGSTLAMAAEPTTRPASQPAVTLKPAPSPGEALKQSAHAMVFGDEEAYRKVVRIVSPLGYSESYAKMTFAGARLQAAMKRDESAKEQAERSWQSAQEMLDGIEWKIEGSYATPANMPQLNTGTQGNMSFEKMDGGWIVVVSDPAASALPDDLRYMAKGWHARAMAMDHAAKEFEAGRPIANLQQYLEQEANRIQSAQ